MKNLVRFIVLTLVLTACGDGRLSPQGGTITSVQGGSGLTGGGTGGAVTLNVGATAGGGLTVGADSIGLSTACASGEVLQWDGDSWECEVAGITMSVGANIIPKSDGANLVASSWTDDGTNTTTTANIIGTNAVFGSSTTTTAKVYSVVTGSGTGLRADNTSSGKTSDSYGVRSVQTGSFDSTADTRRNYSVSAQAAASRSAGSNDVINFGVYTTASGGQANYSIYGDAGTVALNVSSGNTCIGATSCSDKLSVTGTASVTSTVGNTFTSTYSGTGITANRNAITGTTSGATFDTTAASRTARAGLFQAFATRSTGSNDLINVGIEAAAANGQDNRAIWATSGNVLLNTTSGNTCIGATSCSSKLSVTGTASISGNTTIGDATSDTHTINGKITIVGEAGTTSLITVQPVASGVTSDTRIINASITGTVDTTAGPLNSSGAVITVDTSRSAGSNDLTNRALFLRAAGGQINRALHIQGGDILHEAGQVVLNQSSGTTTIGGALTANSTVTIGGTLTVGGNATWGDSFTDAHALVGTLDANGTAGTNGQVLKIVSGLPQWSDAGGITNSAGANVIPKSDGTNLVASSWTDDGTNTTTTANIIGTNAAFGSSTTNLAKVYAVVNGGGVNFRAENTTTGKTSGATGFRAEMLGSFDATAADRDNIAMIANAAASRSAGSNNVTNVGLHADVNGGQINIAIRTLRGDVYLNNTSGNTGIGTAPSSSQKVTIASSQHGIVSTATAASAGSGKIGVQGISTGTYDLTSGTATAFGVYGAATGTRSAGGNNLVNVGLYGAASGGQENRGLWVDSGTAVFDDNATIGGTLGVTGLLTATAGVTANDDITISTAAGTSPEMFWKQSGQVDWKIYGVASSNTLNIWNSSGGTVIGLSTASITLGKATTMSSTLSVTGASTLTGGFTAGAASIIRDGTPTTAQPHPNDSLLGIEDADGSVVQMSLRGTGTKSIAFANANSSADGFLNYTTSRSMSFGVTGSSRMLLDASGTLWLGDSGGQAVNNNVNVLNIGNTGTGQTASASLINATHTGSFNTTSSGLVSVGVLVDIASTRSTGSNSLTNKAISASASGAQFNIALETGDGDVWLNRNGGSFRTDATHQRGIRNHAEDLYLEWNDDWLTTLPQTGAGGTSTELVGTGVEYLSVAIGASTTSATISGLSHTTAESGHPGVVRFDTGSTTNGNLYRITDRTLEVSATDTKHVYEAIVRFPVLSSGSDTYVAGVGFLSDPTDPVKSANGCWISYDQPNTGGFNSGNQNKFVCICRNADVTPTYTGYRMDGTTVSDNSFTTVDAPVAANTWYKLRVEVTDSLAEFYVDDVKSCEIDSNFPITQFSAAGWALKKTGGSTAVQMDVDYTGLSVLLGDHR